MRKRDSMKELKNLLTIPSACKYKVGSKEILSFAGLLTATSVEELIACLFRALKSDLAKELDSEDASRIGERENYLNMIYDELNGLIKNSNQNFDSKIVPVEEEKLDSLDAEYLKSVEADPITAEILSSAFEKGLNTLKASVKERLVKIRIDKAKANSFHINKSYMVNHGRDLYELLKEFIEPMTFEDFEVACFNRVGGKPMVFKKQSYLLTFLKCMKKKGHFTEEDIAWNGINNMVALAGGDWNVKHLASNLSKGATEKIRMGIK